MWLWDAVGQYLAPLANIPSVTKLVFVGMFTLLLSWMVGNDHSQMSTYTPAHRPPAPLQVGGFQPLRLFNDAKDNAAEINVISFNVALSASRSLSLLCFSGWTR